MTKKERDGLIYARYEEGYTQKELGKFYNLSQSSISQIICRKRNGVPEPEEECRGRNSRLDSGELLVLAELLKHPGKQNVSHWNKRSIKALIEDAFGVVYHENYVWEIMKKIGFSSQRPQKKDYRQDEKQVRSYKKGIAGRLKKSDGRKKDTHVSG